MPDIKCGVCGQVFNSGAELAMHVKQAHPQTDVGDYECAVCSMRFEDEEGLLEHMEEMHKDDNDRP